MLVVDSLSNKMPKKDIKKCLDKSNTTNCWIVSYSDLIKGKKEIIRKSYIMTNGEDVNKIYNEGVY